MSFKFVYEALRDFPRKSLGVGRMRFANGEACCAVGVAFQATGLDGCVAPALTQFGVYLADRVAIYEANDTFEGTDEARYAFMLGWLEEKVAQEGVTT